MSPRSTPPDSPQSPRPRPTRNFRQRYDDLERRRLELIERLTKLDEKARASPSYGRALTLLNTTFRKAKLVQRAAVLQSAQWLIDVVEMWSAMV
jgi:hypothetical protein